MRPIDLYNAANTPSLHKWLQANGNNFILGNNATPGFYRENQITHEIGLLLGPIAKTQYWINGAGYIDIYDPNNNVICEAGHNSSFQKAQSTTIHLISDYFKRLISPGFKSFIPIAYIMEPINTPSGTQLPRSYYTGNNNIIQIMKELSSLSPVHNKAIVINNIISKCGTSIKYHIIILEELKPNDAPTIYDNFKNRIGYEYFMENNPSIQEYLRRVNSNHTHTKGANKKEQAPTKNINKASSINPNANILESAIKNLKKGPLGQHISGRSRSSKRYQINYYINKNASTQNVNYNNLYMSATIYNVAPDRIDIKLYRPKTNLLDQWLRPNGWRFFEKNDPNATSKNDYYVYYINPISVEQVADEITECFNTINKICKIISWNGKYTI